MCQLYLNKSGGKNKANTLKRDTNSMHWACTEKGMCLVTLQEQK